MKPAVFGPAAEGDLVPVWDCLNHTVPFWAVPASPHQRISSACTVHSADQQLQTVSNLVDIIRVSLVASVLNAEVLSRIEKLI